MLDLLLISLAPATGGALMYRLWTRRPTLPAYTGLSVGQIPFRVRRRRAMAVRREVANG